MSLEKKYDKCPAIRREDKPGAKRTGILLWREVSITHILCSSPVSLLHFCCIGYAWFV